MGHAYSLQAKEQGKWDVRKNTLSKSTKIFIAFVLLDRLEGKEHEMGNAYS